MLKILFSFTPDIFRKHLLPFIQIIFLTVSHFLFNFKQVQFKIQLLLHGIYYFQLLIKNYCAINQRSSTVYFAITFSLCTIIPLILNVKLSKHFLDFHSQSSITKIFIYLHMQAAFFISLNQFQRTSQRIPHTLL